MANNVINHGYIVESPLETLNEGIRRGSRLCQVEVRAEWYAPTEIMATPHPFPHALPRISLPL